MADEENEDALGDFLSAAIGHGDIEGNDAEIGDLVAALRVMYDLLTAKQRVKFFADDNIKQVIEEYGEDEEDDDEDDDEDESRAFRCQNCGCGGDVVEFVPTDGSPARHRCPRCGSLDVFSDD